MKICEECGQEIKGKPVVENGIVFYHFRCYYAEEITKFKKIGKVVEIEDKKGYK